MNHSQKWKLMIFLIVFFAFVFIYWIDAYASGGLTIFIPIIQSGGDTPILRSPPTPAPTMNPFPEIPTPTPVTICIPEPCP